MHDSWKPTGLIVMSHAVMLTGGLATAGMACATWRAVDMAIDHNAAAMAAQEQQNQRLVASIRTLAEQTGMLTSADLCPVRFRVRCCDGYSVPALRPMASLEVQSDGEFAYLKSAPATAAGTIDFGLNPPGRYRLSIRMDDGMHLEHEFDILPGVPLDRLITCPMRSAPSATIRLEVDWTEQLPGQQLLAACCIEPMPFASGNWVWQPAPHWNTVFGLVCNSERELPASDLFLLDQFVAIPDEPNGGLQPASRLTVPSRYCRLKQITFLGRFTEGQELTPLGTAIFSSAPPSTQSADPATWYCQAPAPTFEYKQLPGNWMIHLPHEVVDELLHRIEDVTSTANPSADSASERDL